ncbi:MAG: bacteriocin-protection protein, YdeI/OmpD-associated family [Chitinophagaceae bacterium]|nr:MAG: bacteriocin-protection protein, YdeI/OmpD-associated family [Chitinophagaceae bacterium]
MTEASIQSFKNKENWQEWLEENQHRQEGVWLQIFRKESEIMTVTYQQALEEAICYGWIDGQKKKYDEQSYLQKFTPRRTNSLWSKRNIGIVEKLTDARRMKQRGIKEVEKAKADGRWEKAYDSPSGMTAPEDFLKELAKNKKAEAFYETLNQANRYSINWRLQTAGKPETRERRMKNILKMLKKGKKFH